MYYATLLGAVSPSVAVLVTRNVLQLVRRDLGSDDALGEWLAELVKRRSAPVMVNLGERTVAIGPGTPQQLLGHIGVHHDFLEQEFGRIARVSGAA